MNNSPGDVCSVQALEAETTQLRAQLASHPIYVSIHTQHDLRFFLEAHVFAVWDFMSLLKSLQRSLTCVELPWRPSGFADARRFINEIVLGEESDIYQGRCLSHFEIYLHAMKRVGANTGPICALLDAISTSSDWKAALHAAPCPAQEFVRSTFRFIESGSLAAQAAAFTFGREDVIPDMFRQVVKNFNRDLAGHLDPFLWYLERHIEVDGDDHGPLARKMIADVCGRSTDLWAQATIAAKQSLRARVVFWDAVLSLIRQRSLSASASTSGTFRST